MGWSNSRGSVLVFAASPQPLAADLSFHHVIAAEAGAAALAVYLAGVGAIAIHHHVDGGMRGTAFVLAQEFAVEGIARPVRFLHLAVLVFVELRMIVLGRLLGRHAVLVSVRRAPVRYFHAVFLHLGQRFRRDLRPALGEIHLAGVLPDRKSTRLNS